MVEHDKISGKICGNNDSDDSGQGKKDPGSRTHGPGKGSRKTGL